MNFEDEPYVRLYVRDTKTWLRLGFEGQCVLMFLLRKVDKAGVLDGMDELDSDVSLVTGVPEAIVAVGMPRLLKWGVFQLVGNRLIMPNYIQAQNAIRTDKARQRDMREKRLAQARLVTPRDGAVTLRDETSREPTGDDGASRDVTLYSADLCSSELDCAGDPARPHVATPGPELEPDTPAAPAPAPANDAPTRKPQWEQFPKGWRWSEATWARAVMAGVSAEQLQEHVDYWTTHDFSRPVNDLDAELVRCLSRIRNGSPYGRPPARASPRGSHNPRASKQPNAGLTGFESLEKPA